MLLQTLIGELGFVLCVMLANKHHGIDEFWLSISISVVGLVIVIDIYGNAKTLKAASYTPPSASIDPFGGELSQ